MVRRLCALGLIVTFFPTRVSSSDRLWLENQSADPGETGVVVGVLATHDDPLHAFSIACKYKPEALLFRGIALDHEGVITGQVGYEYSRVLHDEELGVVVLGVLLDLSPPFAETSVPPSPERPQHLAHLLFDVRQDAQPGAYPLILRNGLGSPPIDNVFSVFGRSVFPELEVGTFTVLNPYHLLVADSEATPGGEATVFIEAEHPQPISGYQLSLRYPSEFLQINTEPLDDPFNEDPNEYVDPDVCNWPITWCGLGLEDLLGGPVDSFSTWAQPLVPYEAMAPGDGSGWVLINVLFDMAPPFVDLPAGRHRIARIRFRLSEDVPLGAVLPLTLVDNVGDPPVFNSLVVPLPDSLPMSVHPELHQGQLRIVRGFERGRINPDQKIDLADVIFLLRYLFAEGPTPDCMKSADTNDDGAVNVADAILLLSYFFRKGKRPAAPFAGCGPDPTPDGLTCRTPPECPQ